MLSAILDNVRTYWMVHLLLAVYTVLLAYHAWYGNRETKGVTDYYVGGRSMGGLAIGLSFFATYSSTNSFVGFSGQAYEWGIAWLLLVPVIVGMCVIAWTVVAPRLRVFTEALGSLTIPDFIGFRFESRTARVAAAFIVIFASFFYMTAVFKGIGNLLEAFLDIPYRSAIVIVFFIVMTYTVLGGFISVVKTDAVQGVIMALAALLLFLGTAQAAGGVGAWTAVRDAPETAGLFRWGDSVAVPVVLGVLFAGTVKLAVEPRQLSRFYALKSQEALKLGFKVSVVAFAAVYAVLIPVGIYARRIIPSGVEDTDVIVPQLLTMDGVFHPGVAAFLLVAMVAAAMSSLDSVLLVMASTTERDIVSIARRRERDERGMLHWTRVWVAVFAAITAVIALNPPGGIVALTSLSGALYGACFGPAILLGLFWRRGSGTAVLASFAAGIAVLVIWPRLPVVADALHEVFPAVALSFLAFWAVGRSTPRPSPKVERLFREADAASEPVAVPA